MHQNELLFVYIAYVIAAGSPGPSTMAIMGVAMSQGRRHAAALAGGVVTMSFTWGLVAATGLSAALLQYAQLLTVLKIVGGAYFLWLAYKSARTALRRGDSAPSLQRGALTCRALYWRGVLMHIGNPKAILSWLAIMSLGVGPGASVGRVAEAFIGCVLLGVVIFFGYAFVFSLPPIVRAYGAAKSWIEGTLAAIFAGAGLSLIFTR